jgi:hypothetical protein
MWPAIIAANVPLGRGFLVQILACKLQVSG